MPVQMVCIFSALPATMQKQKWVANNPREVEDYLEALDGSTAHWAWELHEQMLSLGEMRCAVRWTIPVYGHKTWLAYINPLKSQGVECCFMRPERYASGYLLQMRGRKMVGGLRFPEEAQSVEILQELILEAVVLDRGF